MADDAELVERYLAELSAGELARRLLAAARRDDGLWLALAAEARAASGALDVAALKKQLTVQLRVSSRYLHGRATREYATGVDGALDVLQSLIEAGRAAEVVALSEHVVKRLDTALGKIDDSGGYLADRVERVQAIHLAACEAALPEPRKLAARLLDLSLGSDWEWFLDAPSRYGDLLGEEGRAVYRDRVEREWEKLSPLEPGGGERFAHDRFTITHLREQVARAWGSVDELVSVIARDRSSPYSFLRIADELETVGREREALQWLERGFAAFPPAADARLRHRLVGAYLRDGQVEDAVRVAQRAFDDAPTASTFDEVRRAAGALGDWGARRPGLLERLRTEPAGPYRGGRTEAVAAQLAEGDLDGAWADAQTAGCARHVLRALADASRVERPDDALAVYRALLYEALEHSHVSAYREAVELLLSERDTLVPAGAATSSWPRSGVSGRRTVAGRSSSLFWTRPVSSPGRSSAGVGRDFGDPVMSA